MLDKLGLSGANSFILMFHHVTDDQVSASPDCLCNVAQFDSVLNYLIHNDIEVVSMDDALERVKKKNYKGYAVITFDDGIDNTFEIAYPLLKKHQMPFTVYITLDYLNNEGYIDTEQLKILNEDQLCTIGSHTISHPFLATAPGAHEEIGQSKQQIETLLNKEVLHFAYPFGGIRSVSRKNIRSVRDSGYRSAVTTLGSRLNLFSTLNRLLLPRVNGTYFISNNQ